MATQRDLDAADSSLTPLSPARSLDPSDSAQRGTPNAAHLALRPGLRLHGVYVTHRHPQEADQAATDLETSLGPWVIFGQEGQFVHGCFTRQRPSQRTSELPFCAVDSAVPMDATACDDVAWGVYHVGGGALELLYSDGRSKRVTFSLPLSSAVNMTHPVVKLDGVRYHRTP
jgi:hypothetical protein